MFKIITCFLFIISKALYADSFVYVKNGALYRDNKPYFFIGANYWQAMNISSSKKERLLRELDQLQSFGIKNLRIIGLSEGPPNEPLRVTPALINTPGEMNEELLQGLDFLLFEMKKRNMTAVIVLSNFWPWSGGMAQWVNWFSSPSSIPYPPPMPGGNWTTFQNYSARFYSLNNAIEAQHKAIEKIITRKNTITNEFYKDDSTIMSWQLANEPRGGNNRYNFLSWIKKTSSFIKSLDSNHLISLGSEGDTPYPLFAGNNFMEDHSDPNIDYMTIHMWVENWDYYNPKNPEKTFSKAVKEMKNYIDSHLNKAKKLGKPVILEEFGIARDLRSMDPNSETTYRDKYYSEVFKILLSHAKSKTHLFGVNFWAYSGEGRPSFPYGSLWKQGDDLLGDPAHEEQGWYGVYNSDLSTLEIIKENALKLEALQN